MPQIGPAEIVVVLLIALLVFGPHKLPEVGRQVGRGLREVRKFQDAVKGEIDQVMTGISDDDSVADAVSPVRPAGPLPAPAPLPRAARPQPVPARAGAHAPSRFRTRAAATGASRAGSPTGPSAAPRATEPTQQGRPGAATPPPARAPSRFRAPQR